MTHSADSHDGMAYVIIYTNISSLHMDDMCSRDQIALCHVHVYVRVAV
jgi:hypothetical protein